MTRDRIVWKRRRPNRAAGRLAWTAFVTVAVLGPAWLVFGSEPWSASNGALNPLALLVPTLEALFVLALIPQVLALVRRPVVSADHYALTIRPGVVRTLVLPWAQVAELAAVEVDEEEFLLIRCQPIARASADSPRYWDKTHLRSVIRGLATASAYDLAVPLDDFIGSPESLLADLGVCAPDHVALIRAKPPVTQGRRKPPDSEQP